MNDFSGAEVGDRAWSVARGWGRITNTDYCAAYPIRVKFDNPDHSDDYFTLSGKLTVTDESPSLFWNEIKFDIPQRPKRKVKKYLTGWLNIYPNGTIRGNIYPSELQANEAAHSERVTCIKVNQEYEVEE